MAGKKGRSGGRRRGAGRKKGRPYRKLPDGVFAVRYGPRLIELLDEVVYSKDMRLKQWCIDRLLPYVVQKPPTLAEVKNTTPVPFSQWTADEMHEMATHLALELVVHKRRVGESRDKDVPPEIDAIAALGDGEYRKWRSGIEDATHKLFVKGATDKGPR